MIQYPISFYTNATSKLGIHSTWEIDSQNRRSRCAIPPEFEGPGGGFSPEDLFAQALANCFIATFKVYAEKSRIDFEDLSVNAELTVDLDEQKRPVMKKCIITAVVELVGGQNLNASRISMLAEKAFRSGFVLNSVKTDLSFKFEIKSTQPA